MVLATDQAKEIIVKSLKFLVDDGRIVLNGFVVMDNHIHIIWQPTIKYSLTQIQSSFLSHTAKALLAELTVSNASLKEKLIVNKNDRKYQVWKREPLSIELYTEKVFLQKLNYMHYNPFSAQLVSTPENYKFSSAKFYYTGVDDFSMITHYSGN